MDFVRYAEGAAALVNADLTDAAHLASFLADRPWLQPAATDKDAGTLRRFVRELRGVFEASNAGAEDVVVERLNVLLTRHPVTPSISGHGHGQGQGHGRDTGPGGSRWHLHVAEQQSSVCELLMAESLLGLSTLVCELGAARFGVCDASRCSHVFVDTSPNRSRRYCSDRCSSRANVAAFRARQRAASV
jgi:predicted RNA-binding Zn ribbon-like protein